MFHTCRDIQHPASASTSFSEPPLLQLFLDHLPQVLVGLAFGRLLGPVHQGIIAFVYLNDCCEARVLEVADDTDADVFARV